MCLSDRWAKMCQIGRLWTPLERLCSLARLFIMRRFFLGAIFVTHKNMKKGHAEQAAPAAASSFLSRGLHGTGLHSRGSHSKGLYSKGFHIFFQMVAWLFVAAWVLQSKSRGFHSRGFSRKILNHHRSRILIHCQFLNFCINWSARSVALCAGR